MKTKFSIYRRLECEMTFNGADGKSHTFKLTHDGGDDCWYGVKSLDAKDEEVAFTINIFGGTSYGDEDNDIFINAYQCTTRYNNATGWCNDNWIELDNKDLVFEVKPEFHTERYIDLIRIAECNSSEEKIKNRVISLDLGRQTGKTYAAEKLLETTIKNGEKMLYVVRNMDMTHIVKERLNDECHKSVVSANRFLRLPESVIENARYVVFDDCLVRSAFEFDRVCEKCDELNVGTIVLLGCGF